MILGGLEVQPLGILRLTIDAKNMKYTKTNNANVYYLSPRFLKTKILAGGPWHSQAPLESPMILVLISVKAVFSAGKL